MATPQKMLILAQIPPPTHGQSVMVGHLVAAAGARDADHYVHVNLLLSRDEQDVGSVRPAKLLLLAWVGLKSFFACAFGGARSLYYVPAPGKRGAVIRDVFLLTLLRPFIRRLYLHWHSVGLGAYLEQNPQCAWNQRLVALLKGHHMSICLTANAVPDAEKLAPRQVRIIPNGIPDPCENFAPILSERQARWSARMAPTRHSDKEVPVRLLYLGLCTRSKGIFAALKIASHLSLLLNPTHAKRPVILKIAGPFRNPGEEAEFQAAIVRALNDSTTRDGTALLRVEKVGFASGERKRQLLEEADLFVFPTVYENEGLPLTLLEALAFGLPVITTRWRGIPDIFEGDYPFITDPADADDCAPLALAALEFKGFGSLRQRFVERFELAVHLEHLFQCFESVQN